MDHLTNILLLHVSLTAIQLVDSIEADFKFLEYLIQVLRILWHVTATNLLLKGLI